METFEKSAVEFIMDDNYSIVPTSMDDLVYDDDYEVKFDNDPYWKYNVLETFAPDLYASLNEVWYDYVKLF